jgi:transcription initiation factor TFIIF subunit alpha
MSASPADITPGHTPNGTNHPLIIRRRVAADPLRRPKPKQRRPPPPAANGGVSANGATPQGPHGHGAMKTIAQHPPRSTTNVMYQQNVPLVLEAGDEVNSTGFNSAPLAPYQDYPLVLTKRDLMEGIRHHVLRLHSKKNIDPANEEQFTRPVRLHRRDPRAPPPGAKVEELDTKDGIVDDKEREAAELRKAQREAEREANMAQVAPTPATAARKKAGFNKKTEQVFRNDQTEEQKAATRIRYEEALPWHLEDFDNKQTWVGSYEAALSETYAQFVVKDGKFHVQPLEKWYKFLPKATFQTLSIEEAEKRMSQKVKDPRWFMETQEKKAAEKAARTGKKKVFVAPGQNKGEDSENEFHAVKVKQEANDENELDFEEDRFADDEENPIFEGDAEENKEAEERIKKENLSANFFDQKEEVEVDEEEEEERKLREAEKMHGKDTRKSLLKREKQWIYEDDSDNPYQSEVWQMLLTCAKVCADLKQSDSSSSEIDKIKEEAAKKEAEEKNKLTVDKDKSKGPPSGASSRGNNTPHRSNKYFDPSQASRKRPGSPNLSEQSGNESSRKKHKKIGASNLGTGVNTPNGPPSRPRSPAIPSSTDPTSNRPITNSQAQGQLPRRPSGIKLTVSSDNLKRSRGGAGSGSEDNAAGSGGDMSDSARKRMKLKLNAPLAAGGSKAASPNGSRAGSPDAGASAGRVLSPCMSSPFPPRIPTLAFPNSSRSSC